MRPARLLALAAAVGLAAGCGGPRADPAGLTTPLTTADWKALPADQKYTAETLERLKDGEPSLRTADGWERFQKTVVGPARKQDFPGGKAR